MTKKIKTHVHHVLQHTIEITFISYINKMDITIFTHFAPFNRHYCLRQRERERGTGCTMAKFFSSSSSVETL